MMLRDKILTYRYEPFGGIIHLQIPPALIWVDKDYMRSLGYPDSPLWDTESHLLTAPTEVHASVTNQCSAGCKGCYMGSYKEGTRPDLADKELGYEGWKKVVDAFADARVFHMALGGGESLEMPWFFNLAEYVRASKIVPNLTTNGFYIDEKTAAQCRVFGQINVSIDGLDENYAQLRGIHGFEKADRALSYLQHAGCSFGINTVISRKNYDQLEEIVKYARRKGANQVELLRFKPSGRGSDVFQEMDLTIEQATEFYPKVVALTRRYKMNLRLDCSFMPMAFAHDPDPDQADFFAVSGCHGGEMLMGMKPDGAVNACSFAEPEEWDVLNIQKWWRDKQVFKPFRTWHHNAPEPCRSCKYLALCRGGCHAVAKEVYGDTDMPDPGCPKVREYLRALH